MKELDRRDRNILHTLQKEGRLSNTELAARINLSPSAASTRVKRLTKDGYIIGYMAILSREKLDPNFLVFVQVKLDRATREIFNAFAAAVKRCDDVVECHMVAGGFDYLVKARLTGMEACRQFLSEVILSLPGVREARTYAVMEEVKAIDCVPV